LGSVFHAGNILRGLQRFRSSRQAAAWARRAAHFVVADLT
jgi:hypothetical protein